MSQNLSRKWIYSDVTTITIYISVVFRYYLNSRTSSSSSNSSSNISMSSI